MLLLPRAQTLCRLQLLQLHAAGVRRCSSCTPLILPVASSLSCFSHSPSRPSTCCCLLSTMHGTSSARLSKPRVHLGLLPPSLAHLRRTLRWFGWGMCVAPRFCTHLNRVARRYVSSDLKDHPVGHQAWFHRHTSKFSVHAFMVGVCDGSAWEQRIRRSVATFTVASSMSDIALAHAINKAAIDVLVTMNGWTAGHRMGVMALQPSPISVEWMGGHDTTGADYITYIVSDRVASPPEFSQPFYSEAMMIMPHSFFMNEYRESRASVLSDLPPPRSSLALPPGPLLCNFNQLFKLDPATLASWARLLHRVPQAHLWLLQVRHGAGAAAGILIFSFSIFNVLPAVTLQCPVTCHRCCRSPRSSCASSYFSCENRFRVASSAGEG